MSMTAPSTIPDVDEVVQIVAYPHRPPTRFRLRAWNDARVVVASEVPSNRGMSVTNAAEHVWSAVAERVAIDVVGEWSPGSTAWLLVEHYPHDDSDRVQTLDVVTIAERPSGGPCRGVAWRSALRFPELEWLYDAVRDA